MVFADPWILWVVAGFGALWAGLHLGLGAKARWRGEGRKAAIRFSSISNLKRLAPSSTPALRRLVMGSRVITLALLALALARPQTGRQEVVSRTEVVDIILAIDTSGSMQALDLDTEKRRIADRRNRLQVVRDVVEDFVKQRHQDQLGLVVFGTEAYTQCPLTLDHGVVATFLDRLSIGMAGDATAIGNAIGIATKRLKDSKAKSKVLVLLTDGQQTAGTLSPRTAAEVAKSLGIRIYTVGAGTRGKAPFLVDSLFGKQIQMQEVPLDEETLKEVAAITGGAYFRAEDEKGLKEVYQLIDEMEKTEVETKTYMEYEEQFAWFLIPALILLLLEVLLLGTRLRKIP